MELRPKQATVTGPAAWFTGHVWIDGIVQPNDDFRPGDVRWTPDGEEHWHGAARDHFMTHLSITEGAPTWGDHITDAEYEAATTE